MKKKPAKPSKSKPKKSKPTPPTSNVLDAAPALRTWLESPQSKRFSSALQRASSSKNKAHRASVAVGRRRLEVRLVAGGYDVLDPVTGDPAPFVKRAKRTKSYKPETDAQAKKRYAREIDAKSRKDAAEARKRRGEDLRTKGQKIRKERSKALDGARQSCKVDRDKARAVKGPGRRVAAAKARTRCAGGVLSVEKRFERDLQALRKDLEALKTETRGARRRRSSTTPREKASERREERDDAIVSELERRGLAHLVPLWLAEKDGPTFRGLRFDRAIERFVELVAEREDLLQVAQEGAEASIAETAQCEQASFYASQGDAQAALWTEEHCDEDNRPRRRLSASERTLSMFGGITPASPSKAPKKGKRRGAPVPRGQGSLTVGTFGASFVDTPRDQAVW